MNWAQCQTRPILMIPGPTELPFPVIQAINQPPAIQYDESFDEGVLEPTTLALREVFQTRTRSSSCRARAARRWRPARSRSSSRGTACSSSAPACSGPDARDHEPRGRRLDRVPGRAGARRSTSSGCARGRAGAAQGDHARAQRDVHGHDLPGGRRGGSPARSARSSCSTPCRRSPASTCAPTSGAWTST